MISQESTRHIIKECRHCQRAVWAACPDGVPLCRLTEAEMAECRAAGVGDKRTHAEMEEVAA